MRNNKKRENPELYKPAEVAKFPPKPKGPIKELPHPGPRAGLADIEKMCEQELAELQIESHSVVTELLKTSISKDEWIANFLRWVMPRWGGFWSRFNSDSTMSWEAFEQFVHWECRWQGDSRRVFSIFDPESKGLITKAGVLATRRKWDAQRDLYKGANVEAFKWKFANHWGSLGRGWRLALDTGDTGRCPELNFSRCCHALGWTRNLKTLWRKLTKGDVSRSIYLRDLDPELDKLLKDFAFRLVTRHGNLRQGFVSVCRTGGGHLHEEAFEVATAGLGIDAKSSKLLFSVLDPNKRRYLTEYDSLEFLEIWNPGTMVGSVSAEIAAGMEGSTSRGQLEVSAMPTGSPTASLAYDEKGPPILADFEFDLVMTKDEYSEYLRRRRGARIRQSLQGTKSDPGAECRRKVPIGGNKPRPPAAPKPAFKKSHSQPLFMSSTDRGPPESRHDVWHGLAPNTLGTGKEALSKSARMPSSRNDNSLGNMLSCPATTERVK